MSMQEIGLLEGFDPLFDSLGLNPYQSLVDLCLLIFVVYVIAQKPVRPQKPFSKEQIDELCSEWEPEPLYPPMTPQMILDSRVPLITKSNVTHVTIENKQVLNLARFNFLGFVSNPVVEEAARKTLYVYGVGTCGPRQFYGTIDVHLNTERRIAEFMKMEDSLIFSYGVATSSSSIPSFAGRGDVLVVDKGVSIGIQIGVTLTRSDTYWFEHNNMEDLERVLKSIDQKDKASKKKVTRRFIVIEGVYFNYGDIAPLPKIVELKNKYKYRLMMEDLGIGNLGKTGRGTCEHHNVPVSEVDLLTGNLEHITGSVGGFCCGNKNIVFHQKLNATGYVYSASLPPLLAAHSNAAMDMIDQKPALLQKFRSNVELVYKGLNTITTLAIRGSVHSPVIHLEVANPRATTFEEDTILQTIVEEALVGGVLLTRAKYSNDEKFKPRPSIRISVCAEDKPEDLLKAVEVIKKATQLAMSGLPPVSFSNPSETGIFKRSVSSQGF